MNNEIKEILDYFRNIVNDKKETYTVVSKDTIYLEKLLDYITTLQQKIKHYEETTTFGDYVKEVNLLVDYKSRIEKAINKVQDIIDIGFDYDGYNDAKNLKILVDELVDLARQTKNILNGSDE